MTELISKVICDVCGKELPIPGRKFRLYLGNKDSDYELQDVCETCARELSIIIHNRVNELKA